MYYKGRYWCNNSSVIVMIRLLLPVIKTFRNLRFYKKCLHNLGVPLSKRTSRVIQAIPPYLRCPIIPLTETNIIIYRLNLQPEACYLYWYIGMIEHELYTPLTKL